MWVTGKCQSMKLTSTFVAAVMEALPYFNIFYSDEVCQGMREIDRWNSQAPRGCCFSEAWCLYSSVLTEQSQLDVRHHRWLLCQ